MNVLSAERLYMGWVATEKGLAKNSVDSYQFDLNRFATFLAEEQLTDRTVTAAHLDQFLGLLYDVGFAVTSIQRTLSTVRNYFRFCCAEGFLTFDPAEHLLIPRKPQTLPSVLSVEEVELLLNSVDLNKKGGLRDRALLETLYGTGMRVSELANFALSHIGDDGFVQIRGKGSKERIVPLGDIANQWLGRYLRTSSVGDDQKRGHDLLKSTRRGSTIAHGYLEIDPSLRSESGHNRGYFAAHLSPLLRNAPSRRWG